MKNDSLGAQQHTLFSAINYVFGAGHLRGSRLLSFFAFYYENNIVCGGVVFLHSTMKITLCVGGWGGVGVGWDNNVICTPTHVMQHICTLSCIHIHTYVMLCCRFSCTSTHTSCYAAVDSLALPHMCHATLL